MIAPIYHELSETLEKYIHEHKITGKMPGVLKLSRELGVHHVTLSKAIRILEKKGILSIQGTRGTFIMDAQKRRPRTNVLALVSGNMEQLECKKMLTRLNQTVQHAGYSVISIAFEEDLFRKNRTALLNFPVDGFLFRGSTIRAEQLELLRKEGMPIVSTAKRDEEWLDMVDCDHEAGYELLLNVLHEKRHHRIAFLEFDRIPEYRPYLDNIRRILREKLGADFDPQLFYIRETGLNLWYRYGEEYWNVYAREALRYFFSLPEPPTTIIAPFHLACRLKEQIEQERLPDASKACSVAFVHQGSLDYDYQNLSGIVYDEYEILDWGIQRLLELVSGTSTEAKRFFKKPVFISGNSIGMCHKKSEKQENP